MIYKILNKITEKKITKLHPLAVKFLSNDLDGPGQKSSAKRLSVVRKYALLFEYLSKDNKRRYMINRNYLNFLKAIIYLYKARLKVS